MPNQTNEVMRPGSSQCTNRNNVRTTTCDVYSLPAIKAKYRSQGFELVCSLWKSQDDRFLLRFQRQGPDSATIAPGMAASELAEQNRASIADESLSHSNTRARVDDTLDGPRELPSNP
jgi:hypothetical protein